MNLLIEKLARMANGESNWHLSKAVPISIIIYGIAQAILLVVWGTRLDYRVNVLEGVEMSQNSRLALTEALRDRLIVVEERQNNVIKRLDENGKKLDEILNKLRINN